MAQSSDEELRKEPKPKCPPPLITPPPKTPPPPLSTLTITKELESYDDQNFLVVDSSTSTSTPPARYILKVHNGVESLSPSLLDFQNAIMTHLSLDSINTTTPVSQGEKHGLCRLVECPCADGKEHPLAIRLLKYVEGVPMAYSKLTPKVLVGAGEYLGE